MFTNTKIANSVRLALVLGAVAAGVSFNAAAQTAEQDEAKKVERIEVTGSRIRQSAVATPAPLLTIDRTEIDKQGFQSVADILQNVSAFGTPPISRASPLTAGQNAGGQFVSMRNLGAARTLVLVNGRRMGISTSGLADIATIPAAAVERIEILKDGASSLYGSDAVGGVVNVVTRSNFDGITGSVYTGQFGEGDGETTRGDIVMGFTQDRGSMTFAAEWSDEKVVDATARNFSSFPRSHLHPNDGWTTVGAASGFVTTPTTAVPGIPNGTRVVLNSGADPRLASSYRRQNTNTGTCNFTTGVCTDGSPADKTNTLEQTDLRTPLKTRGLYVNGIYDLNDSVRLHTDLTYANRFAERRVAGFPYQAASYDTPIAANSYFNPVGAPITNWWHRTFDIPRDSTTDMTTYRFSASLEGNFDIGSRFVDWEVSYLHNSNNLVQTSFGNLNVSRVRAAVGPSFLNSQGRVQCGTAAAAIPLTQCVPWNPLVPAGVTGVGGMFGNRQLQDYLFQREHSTGETRTEVIAASASGNLFELPAGDIMYAVGLEQRREKGAFVPDALSVTGDSTNLAGGPTRGGYKVDEAYFELQMPLVTGAYLMEELSLQAASRYSKYDTFGSTNNGKLGMKWRPTDSVLVRGSYSEGFRAPTIADLYGGSSQTFSFFTDPCDTNFGSSATNAATRANCSNALGALANTYRQLSQGFNPAGAPNSQTPVAFNSGSNPTLLPETSKSKTFGVVWSPEFADGLNLALDWWTIRIDDTIVADAPTTILNDCYVQGIASRCSPQLFTRDPVQGYVNFMSFGSRNAGYREVEGYDFDWSYAFELGDLGRIRIASNSTYTASDVLIATNDPRFPVSSVGVGSDFRIRSNMNVRWEYGDWGVTWTARYYSSISENCTYVNECNSIKDRPTGALLPTGEPALSLSRRNRSGSNTFNDLQVRWNSPWDATVSVGVNNIFDRQGPVLYTQPSSNVSYYGGFDIGRFWYMKYTQRF